MLRLHTAGAASTGSKDGLQTVFQRGRWWKSRGWPQVLTLKFVTFGSDRSIDLISTSPYICTTNNALASKHSRPQTLRWHRIFLPATEWCQGSNFDHVRVKLKIWGTDLAKHQVAKGARPWLGQHYQIIPHEPSYQQLKLILQICLKSCTKAV